MYYAITIYYFQYDQNIYVVFNMFDTIRVWILAQFNDFIKLNDKLFNNVINI